MSKNDTNIDNLFNPNLVFNGSPSFILDDYPSRSKKLEKYANKGINAKNLDNKFIKDGYMYLLRGSKNGQDTGFYSREYSKKNTIENLNLDPNSVANAQVLNGNTPFISATTDLYIAASFSQKERIYILKIPVEDVYTFYSIDELLEKEYMIPDFVSDTEIVRSFRYNKFKQIYNYLVDEVGLSIAPEDLGTDLNNITFPDEERIEDMIAFNCGSASTFDPLLNVFQNSFLSENLVKKPMRKIAILTDAHALYEPTKAVLKDIYSKGITEIYSLGDNIGIGPNPKEVMDLFLEYGVISLAGNYEEMINFGVNLYYPYLSDEKIKNIEWTKQQLSKQQIRNISNFRHSLSFELGGKLIGLCHFINDVRFDFDNYSSYDYLDMLSSSNSAYEQFYYTNSEEQLLALASSLKINKDLVNNSASRVDTLNSVREHINKNIQYYKNNLRINGIISYLNEPLFLRDNKLLTVHDYDAIIQGHTHFSTMENDGKTSFYSLRGVGIGYDIVHKDLAHYMILSETKNGFEIENVNVLYDREKMKHSIITCECPNELIKKYTRF